MKKIISAFFVAVLMIFICSSCSCNKRRVELQIGDMNATTYIDITMDDLNSLIEKKENFILFVYGSECDGCKFFKPILNSVIKEKHLIIYGIEIRQIEKGHELKSLEWTPSIVIYSNGKTVLKTDPTDNSKYFADNKGFISLLNKYTYMPTLYYISKEQLDEKIINDENFVIYYSRSSCGDCSYLNKYYLKQYLSDNVDSKHFYIIETDAEGIRFTNGEFDASIWQSFKDNYGLSNTNNPIGHGVGYVPTLQYYENGEIKEMMVYFNDYSQTIQNDDGSTSIVIDNSYYDDNPYNGQTIAYSEYKDKLSPFYNQKLKAFLDNSLEKVD